MTAKRCLTSILFSYDTPKVVQINSKGIGILHNILLLSLWATVIIYVFVLKNGYQRFDYGARASTLCKVKGVTYTNTTDPRVPKRVWDTADLYSHPVGDGSFFVTTNLIATHNQEQGTCPEEPDIGADCVNDSYCIEGRSYIRGHGVCTGKCNTTTNTCMVEAWCPIENDSLPEGGKLGILKDTRNFTVFIKDHVHFPYYNVTRSNLIENIDSDYLSSCRYDPKDDPYCPIFRLGDIASIAVTQPGNKIDDSHFESMAIKGGVISISIIWDCDLDYSVINCKPKYQFSRLDNYGGNEIAAGFNFRYSQHHKYVDSDGRDLYKVYGILFLVKAEAVARAFDLQTFLVTLGSSMALLSLAPFVAEFVLLYIHKNKKIFKQSKQEPKSVLQELMKGTQKLQV